MKRLYVILILILTFATIVSIVEGMVIYEDPPQVLSRVLPEYPDSLKMMGLQGDVWLEVEVLADGTVGEIEILESLHPRPGGLDESAITAVKQWKFKPSISNGEPVATWVKFPVSFGFGSISLSVSPSNALYDLFYDGKLVKYGKGSELLEGLDVGDYTVSVSLFKYKSQVRDISVEIAQTTNLNIELKKVIKDNNRGEHVRGYFPPQPKVVKWESPEYPETAKMAGLMGDVWLDVEVLADGTVGEIVVIESLQPGPGGLDESAVTAVKQWLFSPVRVNGKPKGQWIKFPVSFVF